MSSSHPGSVPAGAGGSAAGAGASAAGAGASADGVWLAATWPFVRGQLPPAPARVIEVGCGPAGGHVPALIRAGYDATGIDPEAPDGPSFRREPVEGYRPDDLVDAVIASLSLHHVDDPGAALDHLAGILAPGGTLVVLEWISEDFDEVTARWCFDRQLRDPDEPGAWLPGLRAQWQASGLDWDAFLADWRRERGLHPSAVIRAALEARFAGTHLSTGPYFYPDLLDAGPDAEQAAIDAGQIKAGCLRFAGRQARGPFGLIPVGRVASPLTDRSAAPRQGDEGAPQAWLVFDPRMAEAIGDLRPGDHVIVLTWLDRGRRDVLSTRPRGEPGRPVTGVFSTRSPDRPNPIGLHPVEILAVDGLRVLVSNLEALDRTPVLDVKPVLGPAGRR